MGSGGPPHPPCVAPPPGIGPDAAGTLQLEDNGRAVCLAVGQELTVFLRALDPGATHWAPVAVSDPGVLEPGSVGIMTLVRGVTGGVFRGRRPGTARLTSERPGCGPTAPTGPAGSTASSAVCGAAESWSATVVVTGR